MLSNELELLQKVKSFFGVGSITVFDKTGSVDYIIRDKIGLGVIKEHFIKYPLRGTKFLDFSDFVRALTIMEQNLHPTEYGINSLIKIAEGMNNNREDFSDMPPAHTIKNNFEYVPLNGNYINGFIAGDGSIYLRTKSNFGSMGIQISQHVKNIHLLREIADYFNSALKVSVHGKKSIQITLGGGKLWKEIISPHFKKYYLHGTKLIRLAKLQEIAAILESREHLERVGKTLVFKPEFKEKRLKIWNADINIKNIFYYVIFHLPSCMSLNKKLLNHYLRHGWRTSGFDASSYLTFKLSYAPILRYVLRSSFWYDLKGKRMYTNKGKESDNNSYLMEVLTGVLLSDASLVKKYQNGGTYLKFDQSVIHIGYFMLVFNIFANQGLCNITTPRVSIAKVKKKSYQYITFNTKSLKEWNSLYALWYKDGKKIIPENKILEKVLTPISLAHWHMGDGRWTGKGVQWNGISISLECLKLSNSGDTLKLLVPNDNRKILCGWTNYSTMVISQEIQETRIGYNGSKLVTLLANNVAVKEQRVYGS